MRKLPWKLSIQKSLLLLFIGVSVILSTTRCQKWITPKNKTQISKHGSDESHYNGQNCMNCHYTEGRGEGWFSTAGTINGNYVGATVRLYDNWGPTPVATIEVDDLGNFYTTEEVDFTNGLNVLITDSNGVSKAMASNIFNGQCNLCHGVTQPVVSF